MRADIALLCLMGIIACIFLIIMLGGGPPSNLPHDPGAGGAL